MYTFIMSYIDKSGNIRYTSSDFDYVSPLASPTGETIVGASLGGGGGSGLSAEEQARIIREEQARIIKVEQEATKQAQRIEQVKQQIEDQRIQPAEEKELTRAEKDIIVQQRMERLRGFSSTFQPKKEDFILRDTEGKFSTFGTISRSFFTTADILAATTRFDKLISKSKLLSTPVESSKLEKTGADIAAFTFFTPALSTTAQVAKAAQAAPSEIVLGTGVREGAKKTSLVQISKGGKSFTTGGFEATSRGKITRGIVVGASKKISQAGKVTLSKSTNIAVPTKSGVNLLGRQVLKKAGRGIHGKEASFTFAAGRRFGQISLGGSKGKTPTTFVALTKGQVAGKITRFQGKVFSTQGMTKVLGSIKNVPFKPVPVTYEIVKPTKSFLAMPISKAGQVALTGTRVLPKFQGVVPTLQGTIGSQFATRTSSLSLTPVLLTGSSLFKPTIRQETISAVSLAPRTLTAPRTYHPIAPREEQIPKSIPREAQAPSARQAPRQAQAPRFAVPTVSITAKTTPTTPRIPFPRFPITPRLPPPPPPIIPFGLPTIRRVSRRSPFRARAKPPRRRPSLFAIGRSIKAPRVARGERTGLVIRPIIIKKKKKKKKGRKK